jgi:heme-degrading monooxygenase HmoA
MMHTRFVRLHLQPGTLLDLTAIYEDRILPALEGTDGCLGAALLVHSRKAEDVVSLTVWRDRAVADAYDEEGRFARLLNRAEHLLAESSAPPADGFPEGDLAVEHYDAELVAPPNLQAALAPGRFARMVSVRVAPESSGAFDLRYRAEAATALVDFPGLQAVLLLRRVDASSVTVGLTLWDGEESAARYEMSGRFEELAKGLSDTLSPLYRWRRSLLPTSPDAAASGSFAVDGYLVKLARMF